MGFINRLRVRTKLLLSFGIVCVLMGIVGAVGINKLALVNGMLNTLYERELQGISHAKDISGGIAAIGRDARQAILETDLDAMKALGVAIDNRAKDLLVSFEKIEPCFVLPEGKALVAKSREGFSPFMAKTNEAVALTMADKNDEARVAIGEARKLAQQLMVNIDEMVKLKQSQAEQAYKDSDVVYANARNLMIATITVGIFLGLGLGFIIARSIAVPLTKAVEVLGLIAEGDLTARLDVTNKDEVGKMADSLNSAVASMHEALSDVRSVADNVASASSQLAAASQQISTGAQEQASSLEETASSLEEITATIKQNADNADQANQLSARSREVAEKGGKVVGDAVTGMQEINAASKRIADIITAIDEIAFQTNLLALNAAVEAARAGEQGRGFAVVAGEVRNLAQRSAGAAKEIKGLIQDSVRKVEVGTSLVNQSGETLAEIITSVKRVTDIVSEISAASREQATGIEQVNRAVSQMDQVTQENASQTEELSGTAEGLSGQAEGLQELVRKFTLDTHTSNGKAHSKSRAVTVPSAAVESKGNKSRAKSLGKSFEATAVKTVKRSNEPALELEMAGMTSGAVAGQDGFVEF